MKNKKIKPSIIGLGYVGFPIFIQISKKFSTVGYDLNKNRINLLNKGLDNNKFPTKKFRKTKKMFFTDDWNILKRSNFFIVCVPTPVDKKNKPDLSFLYKVSKILGKCIKKGDIIFFESTVFPGVTNFCGKKIENISGLKYQKDFFVGYSPERINPGDPKRTIDKISKVVSFENEKISNKVKKVYKLVSKKIIISSNIKEAETSKVIENIQRDLNIALFNEIYVVCNKLGINFNNVINLASTKWNFTKFKPGLVGGHCLPVDPYYFSYLAKKTNISTDIILAGRKVNNGMVNFTIKQIKKYIFHLRKNSKVLILGATYKKNVPDIRNSLALEIYKKLSKIKKIKFHSYDPVINDKDALENKIINNNLSLKKYKHFILLVDHDSIKKKLKTIKQNKILDIFGLLNEK